MSETRFTQDALLRRINAGFPEVKEALQGYQQALDGGEDPAIRAAETAFKDALNKMSPPLYQLNTNSEALADRVKQLHEEGKLADFIRIEERQSAYAR